MKRFDDLNYYELFEIPSTASLVEIQRAYEIAKKTYCGDSIATYSLFDDDVRQKIMDQIEEAFSVLSDAGRRQQYDIQLGLFVPAARSVQSANKTVRRSTTKPEKPPLKQTALKAIDDRSDAVQCTNGIDITGKEINGKLFQELRERQGIPLQEVADKTRINITYLQFIEQDRFDGLPAEVYLKGYLMQYTRMLGLDPAPITNEYIMRYDDWRKSKK